jgi:hypothetical protein
MSFIVGSGMDGAPRRHFALAIMRSIGRRVEQAG